MNKKRAIIIIGILCFILTFAITVQIRTIIKLGAESNSSFSDDSLRNDVLKWKEKYDNASEELSKIEKELESQRKDATKNDETSKEDEKELKKGNIILGLSDVSGEGVEITLKDNQNVTEETSKLDLSFYVVHDIDLLSVVNELKNAGAEAISINDQRLLTTTSITCAGNVAQINGEKVGAPFIIRAIGDSTTLYEALNRPGSYIELLNSSGIVTDIKKSNNIDIGKYNGSINYKYVKDAN